MSDVISHLLHLLRFAGIASIETMGTTPIGVGATIIVLFLVEARRFRRGGIKAMAAHWKGDIAFTAIATIAVWGLLFLYETGATIYRDHTALVAEKKQLNASISGPNGYKTQIQMLTGNMTGLEADLKAAREVHPKVIVKSVPVEIVKNNQGIVTRNQSGGTNTINQAVPPTIEQIGEASINQNADGTFTRTVTIKIKSDSVPVNVGIAAIGPEVLGLKIVPLDMAVNAIDDWTVSGGYAKGLELPFGRVELQIKVQKSSSNVDVQAIFNVPASDNKK